MDGIVMEWGGLLLRWLHIVTAMAWIGSSFYFMHIDAALKSTPELPPGKGGEAWEVHGGGFYHVRKYLVAPEALPDELMWHKWESYTTWISGFFLLVWVYYLSADVYLIDPAIRQISTPVAAAIGVGGLALGWVVYDLLCRSKLAEKPALLAAVGFGFIIAMAFAFQQVFSPRGAFIHTGALMATIMTGNVFLIIIPNQRKVIASLVAGEAADPRYGKIGKIRSTHNNYLTLPVVFLMISGHYPLAYSSPYSFVVVGLVLVAGAFVRHFYNVRHTGGGNPWWMWVVAAAAILGAIAISVPASPVARDRMGMSELQERAQPAGLPQAPQAVAEIVVSRCSMCHGALPVWPGLAIAPKGVMLDTPELIQRWRQEVRVQAGLTRAMPPNNLTEMTDEERAVLRAWGGARTASLEP
ncbi:MAG: cysteine desulfurase [Hyphomicrobiales bacterium]|nr:cysteine desulfurase [Hyphomicrobiales bacterium]